MGESGAAQFTVHSIDSSPRWVPNVLPDRAAAAAAALDDLVRLAAIVGSDDPGAATGEVTAAVFASAVAALGSAETPWFWLPEDTLSWALPAAESLPTDITCDVGALPARAGFITFPHRLLTPGGDGTPCPLRALVWVVAQMGPDDAEGVFVTWLNDDGDMVAPVGWSAWGHGDGLLDGCARGDLDAHSWDRRFLSVLWHLIANPELVDTEEVLPDRASRRRAARARVPAPAGPVRVMHLRPARHGGGGGGGATSTRWWVSGHWRSQPYGPGRTLRRPKWIAAFVKGPEGAPLRAPRRVVTAVDRPPPG